MIAVSSVQHGVKPSERSTRTSASPSPSRSAALSSRNRPPLGSSGAQPNRHGRSGPWKAIASPRAIVSRMPVASVIVFSLAAPMAVTVAVTGPDEAVTETGARAATAIAEAVARITGRPYRPGYSSRRGRRSEELRGDRQGQGRSQQALPLPAAHGADEPVRDRADAVGGGRHDRRPGARVRPEARHRRVPPGLRRHGAAGARDRGLRGDHGARRAAPDPRRPRARGRPDVLSAFAVGRRVELYPTIPAPDGGSIEGGTRATVRAIDESRPNGADHLVGFMESERGNRATHPGIDRAARRED